MTSSTMLLFPMIYYQYHIFSVIVTAIYKECHSLEGDGTQSDGNCPIVGRPILPGHEDGVLWDVRIVDARCCDICCTQVQSQAEIQQTNPCCHTQLEASGSQTLEFSGLRTP